jgi:hypothetical protein
MWNNYALNKLTLVLSNVSLVGDFFPTTAYI